MPARKRTEQRPPLPIRDTAREMRRNIEAEIAAIPEVKTHLEWLQVTKVGAEKILKYLAALVLLETKSQWRKKTQWWKTHLRGLARRLRAFADEVESAYGTETSRHDQWGLSLGFLVAPAPPHDPRTTVEYMRETAAHLEARARAFGHLRKEISSAVRRAPVVRLLRYVSRPQPWSVPEFPLELRLRLAELLHAVCEKYGIKKSFTPDSLMKTFKRHVLRPSE